MTARRRCPGCRVLRRTERFLPLVDECEVCLLAGQERAAQAAEAHNCIRIVSPLTATTVSNIRIATPFTFTSVSNSQPTWNVTRRRSG